MARTRHLRLGPRDDRDRPCPDRRRNEILAVEAFADEGAEDRSGRDLAMVDRKAGDDRIGIARWHGVEQRRQQQYSLSPFLHRNGVSSETSTSRLSSGLHPRLGPDRVMTSVPTGPTNGRPA